VVERQFDKKQLSERINIILVFGLKPTNLDRFIGLLSTPAGRRQEILKNYTKENHITVNVKTFPVSWNLDGLEPAGARRQALIISNYDSYDMTVLYTYCSSL
jgi:hypothetical protein